MVDIEIDSDEVVIRIRGFHRLWAFRREIRIPRTQIIGIEAGMKPDSRARLSRSLRMPGTSVPSLITAGSYRCNGEWAFWDVVGTGENAVTLSAEGHPYVELVVDVRDPKATVDAVQRAIATQPSS